MPRPVLLGYSEPWKAIDTPAAIGAAAAAIPDFDACLKQLGTTSKATELLQKMLYNKVKVCGECKKPNGFTLKNCNGCGHDISATELSKTLNVFSGFMLSIAKSTFPLTISLRMETPTHIVLDDLLALGPAHVNVIPTKTFIPDWRYLLRRPAEGLAVAQQLFTLGAQTMKEQFVTNQDFVKQFTKIDNETLPFDVDTDLSAGYNFPPSQNQLHLQCIFPVVLPYQYYLFERGTHFTPGRFFPQEYVVAALKLAIENPLPKELLQDETAMEAITDYFKAKHGLDSEKVREAFTERFEKNFSKFQKWNEDHFQFRGIHDEATGKLVVKKAKQDDGEASSASCPAASEDAMQFVNKDKAHLQSYGRPYTAEGKTTGKFYKSPATDIENHVDFW